MRRFVLEFSVIRYLGVSKFIREGRLGCREVGVLEGCEYRVFFFRGRGRGGFWFREEYLWWGRGLRE